jgi:hypothetical protein
MIVPIYESFLSMPEPRAAFALGGQAFERHPELRGLFPGAIFAGAAFKLLSALVEDQPSLT